MTIRPNVSGIGSTQGTAAADVRGGWCVHVCVFAGERARVHALPVAGGKFISPHWTRFAVKGDFGAI